MIIDNQTCSRPSRGLGSKTFTEARRKERKKDKSHPKTYTGTATRLPTTIYLMFVIPSLFYLAQSWLFSPRPVFKILEYHHDLWPRCYAPSSTNSLARFDFFFWCSWYFVTDFSCLVTLFEVPSCHSYHPVLALPHTAQ